MVRVKQNIRKGVPGNQVQQRVKIDRTYQIRVKSESKLVFGQNQHQSQS